MGLFDMFKRKNSDEQVYYIEDDESINVYDAADIWASNGKDEDYTFGYTESELEDALNEQFIFFHY